MENSRLENKPVLLQKFTPVNIQYRRHRHRAFMQRQLQVHIPADTGCGISMGELFPGTNADPVADDDICAFIDEGEQTLTCVEVDNVV